MTRNLSSWLSGACLATLAIFCSACGGPSYLEKARSSIDLSGHWQLNEKPETRVAAWLTKLSKNQEKMWHRAAKRARDGRDGDDVFGDAPGTSSSEAAPGQFSNLQWMREQDGREVTAILEWISPAAELDIKQSSQVLELHSSKQEGTRRYVAAESSSLFQTIGTFVVSSGWVDNSYVIRSAGSGENRLQLVETYTLRAAGQQLEKRIEAYVPMLGKQVFTFVYEKK